MRGRMVVILTKLASNVLLLHFQLGKGIQERKVLWKRFGAVNPPAVWTGHTVVLH
jgi:hypothetical protein